MEKFPISKLFKLDAPSIAILGRRGSGKSTFIDFLLKIAIVTKKVEYSNVICVLGSEDDTLEKYRMMYFDEDTNDFLSDFIHSSDEPKIVVLDDVTQEHNAIRYHSKTIEEIYVNGRHNNTIVILVAHSQAVLNPIVRANTDCFVLCSPISEGFIKAIGNEMVGSVKKKLIAYNEIVPIANRETRQFRKLILFAYDGSFYWY